MKQTRRELILKLLNSSTFFLLPLTSACAFPKRPDHALSSRRNIAFFTIENQITDHPYGHLLGGQTALHFCEPETETVHSIPLVMKFPHSLIRSPTNPSIAVIAPREEALALVIDLKHGRTIQKLDLINGEYFYGHGFFDPTGQSLFLTGSTAAGKGFFREFNSDFRAVRDIDTHGESPHDCALIDNGRTIVVANTAWASRGDYSKDLGKYGGSSLLAYKKRNRSLEFLQCDLKFRQNMAGNTLSVAWDPSSQAVVTTTPNGPLTLWSLKEMKAVRQELADHHPHGVIRTDTGEFLVTTANSGLWRANIENGQVELFRKWRPFDSPNISAHSAWTKSK